VKSVLRVVATIFLLTMLVVSIEGNHGILFGISVSKAETSEASTSASNPLNRVFINQSFDAEPTGGIPTNWTLSYPQYGNISVVNSIWYGSGATGKSAMIVDGYTDSNPVPYRFFPQQTSTVAISFAIRPTSNIGVKKTIEVYVDDGNFSGACITFKDGQIGYRDKYYSFSVLRNSYVPDRWYKIKMILNIAQNSYSIYIDDHLVQGIVAFTGPCTQIHRIVFNETSGQNANLLPVAFIDEILGVQGIEIPRDYATIQEGINAANPGDLVFVTKQRTYFESLTIPTGKDGIWLCGEDVNTTIIDESFAQTTGYGQSITNGISVYSNNVRITGLTIRSTPYGTGIVINGFFSTIENSVVINGLGDGIDVSTANNTITGSVIKTNLKCGVRVTGSNTTLTGNIIESNDQQAVLISSWNSDIEDNIIRLNLGCGIQISQGEQNFIRNNTIKKNGIGIECDAGARNNLIYENRFVNNTLQASNADATNAWDDSYPYVPGNETGGGNFWSDFNSADVYSGKNQNQQNYVSLPAPDGICDNPYILSPIGADDYPLFLIQNVTQDPLDPTKINYTTLVNVTATILNSVDMGDAHLEVQYDSNRQNVSMTIAGNKLKGTIPAQKYGTNVTYNVTAHADSAEVFVKSTNYPLSGPYFVGDQTGPNIGVPLVSPATPSVNQTILIAVNVTESQNASGVNRVSLTYSVLGTPWTATMNATGNNTYSAVIPPQTWDGNLSMTITALDNAGNLNSTPVFNVTVNKLPELTVSDKNVNYSSPYVIDFGVLSPGQKLVYNSLRFNNTGGGVLFWSINLTNVPAWVKIAPSNGTIASGTGNITTITVDTTGLRNVSYEADLEFSANGSISSYKITLLITIIDIIIDYSYSSSVVPGRADVNTTQLYGFHASWNNGSNTIAGSIEVKGIGWVNVDASGWANFNDSSSVPAMRTYYVDDVNFTFQAYFVRLFTQKASNLTTIWDDVKITRGGSSHQLTTVGTTEEVWFTGVYEYDNTPFNGTNGILYLNTYEYDLTNQIWNLKTVAEPMNWSAANDRWEKSYSFSTQGSRNFTVSKVGDNLFNLTTIQDLWGPVTITWLAGGTNTLSTLGMPSWAIVSIALTLAFGMAATLIILIRPPKNRASKEDFKSREK
jgi:parallel beta-helix repeat protein